MLLILLGGFVGLWQIDKEVFPQFRPPQVWVKAKYPGAGPQEVEEAVCIPIEEALQGLPGIKRLITEVGVVNVVNVVNVAWVERSETRESSGSFSWVTPLRG